jgi:hypothetical protein
MIIIDIYRSHVADIFPQNATASWLWYLGIAILIESLGRW